MESEHFFGGNIKKVLKYTARVLPSGFDHVNHLLLEMKEKFALTSEIYCLLANYYDEDLATFVVLENDGWSDFLAQAKKHIQLSYIERPPPHQPPPAPVQLPEEVESKHEPAHPSAPLKPPPPPPPMRRVSAIEDSYNSSIAQTSSEEANIRQFNIAHHGNKQSGDLYNDYTEENSIVNREISPPSKPSSAECHDHASLSTSVVHYYLKKRKCVRRFKIFDLHDSPFLHYLTAFLQYTLHQSKKFTQTSLESPEALCGKKKWLVQRRFPPLGSKIYSINGVKVQNLDKDFQMGLIKQRQRPLVIEFEFSQQITIYKKKEKEERTESKSPAPSTDSSNHPDLSRQVSSSTTNSTKDGAGSQAPFSPASNTNGGQTEKIIKFSLFMSKYSSSYASKLRKKVDNLLQDFHECDWAKAKEEKTGNPQATITSLYSYIESELIKLDLFNNKRSRGLGAPDEMTEEHYDSLKDCIEYFIFKRIAPYVRATLFPIYQEKVELTPLQDYEEPPNLMIDRELQVVPINPLYYPIAATINGTADANKDGDHLFFRYGSGNSVNAALEKLELSNDLPLHMKMAYLRFLSLEQLGLAISGDGKNSSPDNPETTPSVAAEIISPRRAAQSSNNNKSPYRAFSGAQAKSNQQKETVLARLLQMNHHRQEMLHCEEWYLAVKGLSRALQLEIPYDILRKLNKCVNLISRALESYILTKMKNRKVVSASKMEKVASIETFNASYYGERSVVCSCGKLHILSNVANKNDPPHLTELTIPCPANQSFKESIYSHHPRSYQLLCEYCPSDTFRRIPKDLSFLKHLPNPVDSEDDVDSTLAYSISADDLLPAIIWTLLQCHLTNIDYIFWICSEFRHPSLMRGEEAYCLAQLSSAIEFIRSANYQSFDLPREIYSAALFQYNLTLKLLVACKNGQLDAVKDCLQQGADINGLSPDHRDSTLTACIQFHRMEILRFLLFSSATIALDEIQVDNPVHLFQGPYERGTALFIAILKEDIESTIILLQAGANRYHQDDSTVSNNLFKIATDEKENSLLLTLLLADDEKYDYLTCIMNHSDRIIAGLLMQGISIHYLDPERSLLSPLITTILAEDLKILNLLLCNNCQTRMDINYPNSYRETALLICVKLCLLNPNNYQLVLLAATLLRNGANRYLSDIYGQSPVSLLQEIDVDQYHPDSTLAVSQKEQLCNGAIGYYYERLQAMDLPSFTNNREYGDFVLAFFQSPSSTLDKKGGAVATVDTAAATAVTTEANPSATNPSFVNYALFFMKLLILTDPLTPTTITTSLPKALPIYDYARNKDIYTLKALLLQGVDINAMSPSKGFNSLISAVYNQDLDMIKTIVQANKIYALTDYQESSWFDTFYQYFSSTVSNYYDYEKNIDIINQYIQKKAKIQLDINITGRNDMTALHYAAQHGDANLVGLLLQYGAKRDVINQKKHVPLDIAIANGHIDAANALRFDPEKVSICLAAKHGDWLVMKALLCQGISINATRQHVHPQTKEILHELYTPLIAAVAYGQKDLVKQMLELPEIDVNVSNLLGQTPLMYAATRGDEALVLKLLKSGANRYAADQADHNALYWAESQLVKEQAVPVATPVNANTSAPLPTPVQVVSPQIKSLENVIAILKTDPQRTFIHDIIRKNDFPGVVAMLKQNADPNQKRMTLNPIQDTADHWIAGSTTPISPVNTSVSASSGKHSRSGSVNTTEKRKSSVKGAVGNIPAGVDPNSLEIQLILEIDPFDQERFIQGETPLMVAARYNRIEIISLLLKAPTIDINLSDSYGHSALFHAAIKGNEEAVLLLLKHKINRRHLNKKNQTAVEFASALNHLQIAALIESDPYHIHIHDKCEEGKLLHVIALLKQGCPPNYRDERAGHLSQTPLMAAAKGGKAEIVRMLLRYPEVLAAKDDRDNLGRTALMLAARQGALDVTAILLNAGCDRSLTDKAGLSARDHAGKHSYTVMFQFMGQTVVR